MKTTKPMRLLLVAPSSGKWQQIGKHRWFNGRTFRFSMLSLLSVAAETPPGVDITLVDEQVENIPWDEDFDLVGITCMTALAPRAYEIAEEFRRRQVPVILGGMHPSFLPEEALKHADAVVVGEAEGVWPRVVEDALAGRLGSIYRNESAPSLSGLKRAPRRLMQGRSYATLQAVQATRGCPHSCDFCAVSAYNKRMHRQRPVPEVVEEVRAIPGRFFVFVDDNLTANRDYARDLFRQLAPLGKRWISQTTIALADDPELLQLAADAGCIGVFVGLETFSARNLDSVGKTCNRARTYQEAIRRFHAKGIAVEAGIVFGFQGDRPAVFGRTLRLLDEMEVDAVQVSIFTPLPGTPRFAAMQERLVDRDWAHYDFHHVVFEPAGMPAASLQAGHDWVTREFYRPWRIARRVARHLLRPRGWAGLPLFLAINLAYYGRVLRWSIAGWDPAAPKSPTLGEALSVLWGRLRNWRRAPGGVTRPTTC